MKKLIVIFSLFLSASAFAQKADSVKKESKINTTNSYNSLPPLVMVDGTKYIGDIKDLNANDIESVEVLKSASSTSIYGAEGLNGVILVTTKKGKTTSPKWMVTTSATPAQLKFTPLYIIDDNKVTETDLQHLNPNDIDNMSVLKDSSSTALYGEAGKNGVVIVTTKAYKKKKEASKEIKPSEKKIEQ